MARKKKHEEPENHERWLVSYADFITLLFAFFVIMYAISSVNEGKYRVLSSSLVTAFSQPAKTLDPIQQGNPLRAPIIQHKSMVNDAVSRVGVDHQIMPSPKQLAEMQKIADEVEHSMKDLIDKEIVDVKKTNQGVEIEIKSKILFTSGKARLSLKATPVLKKIAAILNKIPSDVNVEGYTDNIPIKTFSFPSNWELSAARAASVVRLFTQSGLDPVRLKAIGFGEHHPIASNVTEKGRSKNRRVAIVVLNEPNKKRKEILDKKSNDKTSNDKTLEKSAETKQNDLKVIPPKSLPSKADKPKIKTLPRSNSKSKPTTIKSLGGKKPPSVLNKPNVIKRPAPLQLPSPIQLGNSKREQS